MNYRGRGAHRAAPFLRTRRWNVVLVLMVLLSLPGTVSGADITTIDLPPGVALLQTRVRLARSVPFLPANTARYFRAGYATPIGAVDVFLTETTLATGLPPADAAEAIDLGCGLVDIVSHDGALEVLPPAGTPGVTDYRVFLVLSVPLNEESRQGVCTFAGEFVRAFTFFLEAALDRGQGLSFSGNRMPEFPAVLDLGG